MEASSSSSSSSGASQREKVRELCSITGLSAAMAESLLDACNGSMELAVNMHMEGVDLAQPQEGTKKGVRKGTSVEDASPSPRAGTSSADDSPDADDNVRAPIPQRQETLVGAGYEGYALRTVNPHKNRIRTVFDGFRNFGTEAEGSAQRGKKRTLEELFKPPLDVMHRGDWQSARDTAEKSKKWLLVNIQNAGEFQCQVLNRDVWSSEAVKTIIREHFIFWQQYQESDNAQRYMTFYPVTEWPHVSILDPRTGEQIVIWTKITDSSCFCDLIAEFLTLNPVLEEDSHLASKRSKTEKSILDADEDDQLAAAIQASLADSAPTSSSNDCCSTKTRETNFDDDTDSEFEPFSGEDSNFSLPTPVKSRSVTNSRAPSPAADTEGEAKDEEWRQFLGKEGDETSCIMIRFPDGKRESQNISGSSQFKAIAVFVASRGFPLDKFEIVTNFPRRILTDLDSTSTLKDLGLFPQETVFVQQRP